MTAPSMHTATAPQHTPDHPTVTDVLGPSPLDNALQNILEALQNINDGEVNDSILALAEADRNDFGIVIATADGHVYEAGDSRKCFSIQSISKTFTYAMALEDHTFDHVDSKIDVEPSGDAFNEISIDPQTKVPANPMINAGAIAATWLVKDGQDQTRRERILENYSRCAGRELDLDIDMQKQEHDAGDRNRALGWLLASAGVIEGDPTDALEDYFAQCCVMVDTKDLALMGATLASGGVNPRTGERVFRADTVERVLSVMNSCGMYDDAGDWFVRVGLPAKSGVGGGIIAVVPGQLAVATFSPALNEHGTSVRGKAACEHISQSMDLHFARGPRPTRSTVRAITSLAQSPSLMRRDEHSRDVLSHACRDIAVIEIQGDLMFPGVEDTMRTMRRVAVDADAVVVDFSMTDEIAAFTLRMLAAAARNIRENGREVYFITGESWEYDWGDLPVFSTRDEALIHVEDAVLEEQQDAKVGQELSDEEVLIDSDLLRRTGKDMARRIWKYSHAVTVPAGEYLPEDEAVAGSVHLVVQGTAQIVAESPDGGARPIRGLRPGTVFGDPRGAQEEQAEAADHEHEEESDTSPVMRLQADTEIKLHTLDPDSQQRLEAKDPQAALALWKALAWVEAEDVVASLHEALGWEPGDHWHQNQDLAADGEGQRDGAEVEAGS